MRFKPDHLDTLRAAIAPLDTPELRDRYARGDFPRADAVRDLDRRYRWDLFWTAGGAQLARSFYAEDYSDTHIDTALRAIVPPLAAAEVTR